MVPLTLVPPASALVVLLTAVPASGALVVLLTAVPGRDTLVVLLIVAAQGISAVVHLTAVPVTGRSAVVHLTAGVNADPDTVAVGAPVVDVLVVACYYPTTTFVSYLVHIPVITNPCTIS